MLRLNLHPQNKFTIDRQLIDRLQKFTAGEHKTTDRGGRHNHLSLIGRSTQRMFHLHIATLERLNTTRNTIHIRHATLIQQRLRQRPKIHPPISTVLRSDASIHRVRILRTNSTHLRMIPNPLHRLHRHRNRIESDRNTHRQLTRTPLPPTEHLIRRRNHRKTQMRLHRLMSSPDRILHPVHRLRPRRQRERDEEHALARRAIL